jgi:hypothetical protein
MLGWTSSWGKNVGVDKFVGARGCILNSDKNVGVDKFVEDKFVERQHADKNVGVDKFVGQVRGDSSGTILVC